MNLSRSITGAVALVVSLLASMPATAEMTLDSGMSVTFHHHDLLGSPVMVSDHKGRVLWYENTKPFGESLGKKSSSGLGHLDNTVNEATSNLGYTGHTVDSSTGLVYMKARHYDPVIGRFYSNDPVGFKASNPMMFNRYAYANNNPYAFVDPDGRQATFMELDFGYSASKPLRQQDIPVHSFNPSDMDIAGAALALGILGLVMENRKDVPIEDLDPLHPEETIGDNSEIEKLSDEELLDSANNPENNDPIRVNTKTGKLVDGNSRAQELKKRADSSESSITPETTVPVDEYTPDDSMFWDD